MQFLISLKPSKAKSMNKPIILIVDDEPININMIAELLRETYHIKIANNGTKAIDIVKKQKPDLILLDIHLPDMDGYEVAERLQGNPATKEIPIVFITSRQDSDSVVQGFRVGAVDYIFKPFNQEELLVRVQNHIKIHSMQKELNRALVRRERNLKIMDKYVAFIKTDTVGVITEASTKYCKKAGCSKYELIGQNTRVLKSDNTPTHIYEDLWKAISSEQIYNTEIENKNFVSGTNWYDVTILPDYNDDKQLIGYIAFYDDIDEKIMIKKISETDALTGIYNRKKIDQVIEQEYERGSRYGVPFSLLLIDIDHFKAVNDHYGHQIGDKVLIEFARILRKNIRKIDLLGRWGGEEFLIVCANTDGAQALLLADKLRKKVENHIFPEVGHKTMSIGIAEYKKDESIEHLFNKVDKALYLAKESGRNQSIIARD